MHPDALPDIEKDANRLRPTRSKMTLFKIPSSQLYERRSNNKEMRGKEWYNCYQFSLAHDHPILSHDFVIVLCTS